MKKFFYLILIIFTINAYGQTPNAFRYQASIQNNNGSPMANKNVSIRISVLKSDRDRERVYAEYQNVTTDEFGMINIMIGKGNAISGNFSQLNWGDDEYFLRIEMDDMGDSQFKQLSEVQLLSVPYALHAKTADNVDDADADAENELQQLSLDGQELSISNGNTVTLPADGDSDSANEIQTLTYSSGQLSISNGNSVTIATTNVPTATDQPIPVAFRGVQLFVHPGDNASAITFGAFSATGASSDADGQANSAAIVAALGDGSYAAKVCDDLVAFGFEDWYLPSRAELDAINKQSYLLADYGLEGYWSSTETADNKAYTIDFMYGSLSDDTKNQPRRAVCVRKD